MSRPHVLGLDLGTTGGRASLSTLDGPTIVAERPAAEAPRDLRARILDLVATVKREWLPDAERFGAVLSVPAHADFVARRQLLDAAHHAGLAPVRLLDAPTAAALAYARLQGLRGPIAVFAFGAETFDVSLMSIDENFIEVLASAGDVALGGGGLDRCVAAALEAECPAPADPDALFSIAAATRWALGTRFDVPVEVPLLDGRIARLRMTRDRLEAIAAPVLARVEGPCREALIEAGFRAKDLSSLVLVGGGTQPQHVRRFVGRLFGLTPSGTLHPERVVALGCALHAARLEGGVTCDPHDDWLVLDALAAPLVVLAADGEPTTLLPRGARLPASVELPTSRLLAVEGRRSLTLLAREGREGERTRTQARWWVEGARVRCVVDTNGDLTVSATAEDGRAAAVVRVP
jgi:molecular chaperone HscA